MWKWEIIFKSARKEGMEGRIGGIGGGEEGEVLGLEIYNIKLHSTSEGANLHPSRIFCSYFYFSLKS